MTQLTVKPARKKKQHLESNLQQQCVRWFRYQYPKYKPLLFAIPNGGARSRTEAAIMKAEGVTPGVPDLMLAVPRGANPKQYPSNGLFMELKAGKNTMTIEQRAMCALLKGQGYEVIEIRTFDEFQKAINEYLKNIC